MAESFAEETDHTYHRVVQRNSMVSSECRESVCTPSQCLCKPVAPDTDVFLYNFHGPLVLESDESVGGRMLIKKQDQRPPKKKKKSGRPWDRQ